MPSVSESVGDDGQLAAGLAEGLEVLSSNQVLTFTKYTRYVLPLDGFVFWVRNGVPQQTSGSMHYSTTAEQREDETISINRVLFTSESPVNDLNEIDPDTMCICECRGMKFAFRSRGMYYEQAKLHHYQGEAVHPALASQIINSLSDISGMPLIVSNSLPIWLARTKFGPIYPSFLVPANARPPYIAVHIDPDQTTALQEFMTLDWPGVTEESSDAAPLHDLPSSQLMRDQVKFTFYGFTNQQAIQFLASLIDYSLNTDDFGFCNSPAIRDEKRGQVEIASIAMKKSMTLLASYYQRTSYAAARRLILSATVSLSISE